MKRINFLLAIGMLGAMLFALPTTTKAVNPTSMAVDEVNDDALEVTIAEFNAAEVSTTVWYKLSGTVRNLKDGDQYGNFDLEDETGSVYVYGLLSEKGGTKKLFQQLVATYGITNGSKITIIGNRGVYNEKIEVLNAYYVSDKSGEGETVSDVLEVTYNSSSGINNAYYTGTLEDGTILGFYLYTSDSYACFCGAISSATSIVVPEKVSYNGKEYNVQYFGYYSGYNIDFDQARNIKSLTLPSVLTYIYNRVPTSVSELHLLGTTPPTIYSSSYISLRTTVYVPKSAYGTYQNYCNKGNNGWSTSIDLRIEGWEPHSYTVTVNTAGTLANQLLAVVDQWTDVDELTVIGHLNAEDMKIFSRMNQLRKLDLSQTDITSIGGCANLTKLETVLLPSTVKVIEDRAFSTCNRLKEISLSNVEEIGSYAFYRCQQLTSPTLTNVQTIGSYAFAMGTNYSNYYDQLSGGVYSISMPKVLTIEEGAFCGCMSLQSVSMPSVTSIGTAAFANCPNIDEIDISNVTSLGSYAFYIDSRLYGMSLALSKVTFNNDLEEIPNYCFYGCSSLMEINFPTALKAIGNYAIPYLATDNVVIPEGVVSIGSSNFSTSKSISIPSTARSIGSLGGSNLQDVYCYLVVPPTNKVFSDTYASQATLHVPAFSVTSYKLDDEWYKFGSIVAMDGTIDKLNINSNFTIVDYTGLADKVDLTMTQNGHLTVSASSTFNLGTFTQEQATTTSFQWDSSTGNYIYTGISSMVTSNEIKADNVNLCLTVQTNRWNFISFPFDVSVSDIEYPEGTLWVIRKYSGADRAALTGNTWQNLTNGTVLQAGEGYILHCANESTSTVEFIFHAVNNAKKNGIFAYQDVVKPLATYASEHAHNRSWNLVGNPYPAYFDTHSIEHNGVITVYNGNNYYNGGNYTAYSLLDDDYVLRPNEAFFVQCPVDATSMTFKAEGRSHEYNVNGSSTSTRTPRKAAPANSSRKVYNFTLSSTDFSDRARLVINPDAKMDYEISCDASKFMSDDASVPQLYVLDNGIRYAIDERPLGDGIITLGARFGQTGDYTIALKNNPAEDMSILLIDNETDREVNIAEESYTFTAQAGTFENRFTLVIGSDVTGVNEIVNSESSNSKSLYDLQGRRTNSQSQKGIYIIKQNGKSRKVIK